MSQRRTGIQVSLRKIAIRPVVAAASTHHRVAFLGKADLPAPVTATLEALLNSPEDFEGLLVRVNASLINLVAGPVQQTLVLQASNTIFTAHIESPQADARFRALKLGSEITLTGVFVAQPPNKWMPQQIRSREIPSREKSCPMSIIPANPSRFSCAPPPTLPYSANRRGGPSPG